MTTHPPGIRIVLISGSVRLGSYTGKSLALVADEIGKHSEIAAEQIDPAKLTLPLPGTETNSSDGARLRESVSSATGVILATPEYHGSFSSVIKLVIENLGFPSVLAGKPVALLGVAAGQIGAIKAIEGLASVCSHVGAIVLPGPVSVANVQRVFDVEGRCLDPGVEKRIRSVALNLIDYIHGAICPRVAMEAMARGGTK
jgi:FMN reductase